jgi:hypothetical protein
MVGAGHIRLVWFSHHHDRFSLELPKRFGIGKLHPSAAHQISSTARDFGMAGFSSRLPASTHVRSFESSKRCSYAWQCPAKGSTKQSQQSTRVPPCRQTMTSVNVDRLIGVTEDLFQRRVVRTGGVDRCVTVSESRQPAPHAPGIVDCSCAVLRVRFSSRKLTP